MWIYPGGLTNPNGAAGSVGGSGSSKLHIVASRAHDTSSASRSSL
jgi:hypothetical protein